MLSVEQPIPADEQPIPADEQPADEQPIAAGDQPILRNERSVSPNDRAIPPDELSVLVKQPCLPANEPCLPANEPSLPPNELAAGTLPEKPAVRLDAYGVLLDEATVVSSPMLPYVQMAARLISGVSLSLQEVVTMILQAMRQHSMASGSEGGYVHGVWHQRPP